MVEWLILIVIFGIVLGLLYGARLIGRIKRGDPTVWERELRKFRKQDQTEFPPSDMIVFTGSSSIRYWKSLNEDMAPLLVLNRGFGGSRILDVIHYVDEVVLQYQPRGVVLYAGENDITGLLFSPKHTPEDIRNNFQKFCDMIWNKIPGMAIYFVSIKPPKRRKKFWPIMQEANRLVEGYCISKDSLHYIDIVPPMLDEDGNANPSLFKWDGIHMNADGYVIWSSIIKPILSDAFL